jgi:histidinol-phosphate aminotransferase
LTSPGNPTGKLISPTSIHKLLQLTSPFWNGLLILDEAYIDFSPPNTSLATAVTHYPNLLVFQTLSKAFGLAGIRLGVAFAAPEIAHLFNCIKAPYNISSPASALAMKALSAEGLAVMRFNVNVIWKQRDVVVSALQAGAKARKPGMPGIGNIIGGLDANFILVQIVNRDGEPDNDVSEALYKMLAEEMGVVVRFRGNERGCVGAWRVTVGTADENTTLLMRLKEWQHSFLT